VVGAEQPFDAALLAGAEDLERPSFEQRGIAAFVRHHAMRPQHFGDREGLLDGAGDRHSGRKMPFGGGGVCLHDAGDGRVVAAGDSRLLAEHAACVSHRVAVRVERRRDMARW
jgi:hypothetical protein